MPNELKPCPFCGGEAKLSNKSECAGFGENATYYFVRCTVCGSEGKKFDRLNADTEIEQKFLAVLFWEERYDNDR